MRQAATMTSRNNQPPAILPADINEAAGSMIRLSARLIELADRESETIVRSDWIGFAALQEEKDALARHYERAGGEFRARIEDFRRLDRKTIDRIEALQETLGEKTRANNTTIENIRARAERKTQDTLLSAQELGQSKPVRFEGRAFAHSNENSKQEGETS